ncbi:MAG TPA: MoaD/ThiS family protein [Thermodesulfobacteriota bacterium]|nr:MoaD/ThiS family protein [Thermodesulfobacteriota bacterium]
MLIYVKCVGTVKSLEEGPKILPLEFKEQPSVSEVMRRLNLQEREVGFVLINGRRANPESLLNDQDHLALIAPLAGG